MNGLFFARDRRGYNAWRGLVAPSLGALGLMAGVLLIMTNFEIITGTNCFMLLPTPLLCLAGFAVAALGKRRRSRQ